MNPKNKTYVEYFVGIVALLSWAALVASFPVSLLPETGSNTIHVVYYKPVEEPVRHVWELTVTTPFHNRMIVVHGHWEHLISCNEWQVVFRRNGFTTSVCYHIPYSERAL